MQALQQEQTTANRLLSFIERAERLNAEKAVITEDIKEVYAESKSAGFEPKIIRKIVAMRKMELQKRREENELLELYTATIGMEE